MDATNYDPIADWYDERIRHGLLLHDLDVPTVLDLIDDVRGEDICDLACGQGVVARELASRGARVIGVDISERLLELARQYKEAGPLGITYIKDDAPALDCLAEKTFDGVVCNMGLMNIPTCGPRSGQCVGY